MRKILKIYIHCSASSWGSAQSIREFHTAAPPQGRGWKDIGYHHVVGNGFPTWLSFKDNKPLPSLDGKIEPGRPEDVVGSHVKGDNVNSIGVCLVGGHDTDFSFKQVGAAAGLVATLCKKYSLTSKDVLGHREFWTNQNLVPKKNCPVVNMVAFRLEVSKKLTA